MSGTTTVSAAVIDRIIKHHKTNQKSLKGNEQPDTVRQIIESVWNVKGNI